MDIGAKKEIEESTNVIIVDNKIGFKMVWLLFKWLLALNIAIIPFALLCYSYCNNERHRIFKRLSKQER